MIQEKEIIKRSQQQLLQLAEQLNDIEIIQFQDKVLHSNDFRSMVSFNGNVVFNKSKHPIIYTIELIDTAKKGVLLDTFQTFSRINKTMTKNVTRINHSLDNSANNNSNFLYVGSSIGDFSGRLKNHLGIRKSVRTYSLHLSKWDTNLDYNIRVVTYQVKDKNKNPVSNNIVELIEQQIWDKLKPLFGKRSGLL
nr:hypothetical protein [Flavobacterium sp. ASV13]